VVYNSKTSARYQYKISKDSTLPLNVDLAMRDRQRSLSLQTKANIVNNLLCLELYVQN